ncbi:MAG: hypothetical protein RLZZ238_1405 [Planctomycetota bacterium]
MRRVIPLLLLPAVAGCAAPDAALDPLWPGQRESIYLAEHDAVRPDPLALMKLDWPWPWSPLELDYEDGGVRVHARVERAGAWVHRRLEIDGVAPGLDVLVRVPARCPDGVRLVVEVNGSPLQFAFGDEEAWVPLARDEATVVSVRVAGAN